MLYIANRKGVDQVVIFLCSAGSIVSQELLLYMLYVLISSLAATDSPGSHICVELHQYITLVRRKERISPIRTKFSLSGMEKAPRIDRGLDHSTEPLWTTALCLPLSFVLPARTNSA